MLTLVSFVLVLIGAFNWFSIGFFQFDFVAGIFGTQASIFSRVIYIAVGIAAIWLTYAALRSKGSIDITGSNDSDKELLTMKK